MTHPTPPRSPYEEVIVAIWRDVLGRPDIGVFDDFFDLGGHSLHAIKAVARIRKALDVDIPVRDFFESPTVAALGAVVAARSSSTSAPVVTRRPADAPPVLSFDQQRLWLENQLVPSAAYNIHGRRRLIGPLDVAVLEASIRAILARHEALRTRFPTVSDGPVQVVDDPDENWRLTTVDLSGDGDDQADDGGRVAAVSRLADEQAQAPFDLVRGPLFRCLLIKLSDTEHLLSVTMHHIVSDGWSVGLFVRELKALYQAGGDADRADLPGLPVQYRDHAVWQRDRLVGEVLERQVSYWRRHLADAPPALTLPAARRRSPDQGAGGDRLRAALSAEHTAALHDLGRKYGVSWFMTLLAALATVLGRWSGQSDVVIGVPIAGRTDAGIDKLIGFFVNTLPLRIDMSGDLTFADLLGRVRQIALDGYSHAEAPFDVLVKELQVIRDPSRTPLFQIILNVIDSLEIEQVGGITIKDMDCPVPPSKFDLSLTARETDGALLLELDFNAERHQADMMRTFIAHITTLLQTVIEDPGRPILDYSLQPSQEIRASSASRPTTAPYLAVERHAQLPDRAAVIDRGGEWSYRWLSRAADRIAQLLAQRDADHIGVIRRPTVAFVAAVLGCMKAGATFSVIEPTDPSTARHLGISTVLDASPADGTADGTINLSALLEDMADQPPTGREGTPGSAADFDWAVERFGLGGDDRFAVLSCLPGHLLSAMSSAFYAGAALVIPERPLGEDIGALTAWLQASSVSVMYVNPPILRAIAAQVPQPQFPALRYVFIDNSGELISHDIDALRQLAPTCRCVSVYRVGRDGRPLAVHAVPDDWQLQTAPLRVRIGTELEGAPAHLLHPSGSPAAVGEVGEICFGSHQTGDLGRRWSDGTLEFVGQPGGSPEADLAQTLAALRDMPEVRDAMVTEQVGMDGRTVILGYVTGPDPALDTAGIRQRLVVGLPEYLIPQHLFVLDKLPLTPEGEYDLGALPEFETEGAPADNYVAPRTPMERQLTEMLTELLAVERVGIHDSFFELGGFSLLATRLTSRIREIFDVELSLRDVFESLTVDRLAQLVLRIQGEQSGTENLEALLMEIGSSGT
jgi:non-ribosomal peptide synthetase component F/acyl carrier protein